MYDICQMSNAMKRSVVDDDGIQDFEICGENFQVMSL